MSGPLPWQHGFWQKLLASARRGTLAHALLLKGAAGVGKLHFAQALAGWLLCEADNPEGACQQCKGCALVQAGNHPDLLRVEPEEAGRPIRIAQIRTLNDFAQKTAQQGGHRIIIINPAQAMNVSASNALLKSLEEPGEQTLFLLVSQRAGGVLPTIASRCQPLHFALPEKTQALSWLAATLDQPEQAGPLLTLAQGAPLLARDLAGQDVLARRQGLVAAMGLLFRGSSTPVELARKWQNHDVVQTLEWLAGWLEDAVRLRLSGQTGYVYNQDQVQLVAYLAERVEAQSLLASRDWLLVQRQSLLASGNLNIPLLLESVFCRCLELIL